MEVFLAFAHVHVDQHEREPGPAAKVVEQNAIEGHPLTSVPVAAPLFGQDLQRNQLERDDLRNAIEVIARQRHIVTQISRIDSLEVSYLARLTVASLQSMRRHPPADVERMRPHFLDGMVDDSLGEHVNRFVRPVVQTFAKVRHSSAPGFAARRGRSASNGRQSSCKTGYRGRPHPPAANACANQWRRVASPTRACPVGAKRRLGGSPCKSGSRAIIVSKQSFSRSSFRTGAQIPPSSSSRCVRLRSNRILTAERVERCCCRNSSLLIENAYSSRGTAGSTYPASRSRCSSRIQV